MAHKRQFRDADLDNDAVEEKRHRMSLKSVVLEAVRANAMQKFWVVLEPTLRRVVSEEVERVVAKYLSSTKLGSRLPSKQLERSEPTSLRLQFLNNLALPLYTGCKVEGEHGRPIQISLQDANTGETIIIDHESSVKLNIVVLEGDFSNDEEEDWTYEQFENHVVKEREGKGPLLVGDLSISLTEGIGTLGELIFTDNSSWIRSRKFRLGVRLLAGYLNGMRVLEAKTEAFFVKDHRGQLYKKHYPPNLNDDVWRLEKIGKDGAYHKRLCEYQVKTVGDFLVLYATGPSRLREIFGTTMSTKTWDSIIDHAKTCILDETQHVYYPDDTHTIGVILNTVYQPLGVVRNETFIPTSSLSDTEQVYMDRLVQEAHSDVSSLHKLPAKANYHEAYIDQSSLHKLPVRVNCQELEVASRSGRTRQVYEGLDVPERQQFEAQRNAQSLYESNGAMFSTGFVPNVLQNDTPASTIGLGVKQSLFSSSFSPGTLESLFAYGNNTRKEVEPVGEDLAFYRSHSRYADDYINRRTFGQWGNNELFMLTNVNTGSFSNARTPENLNSTVLNAQNHYFNNDSLHPRAYMGWRKLKLVLKCISYFMKKAIASRRQVQIEQLY